MGVLAQAAYVPTGAAKRGVRGQAGPSFVLHAQVATRFLQDLGVGFVNEQNDGVWAGGGPGRCTSITMEA